MFTRKTNMWLSIRTSLSVEGGSVCANATKPIGRRTERAEPGTSAGRQRIRPVTWITWQPDVSILFLHTRPCFKTKQDKSELTELTFRDSYTVYREEQEK